ncbi:MAG: tetratricopeptide repeat protein [Flavobacteriales bacterium]|jgi:class 3 adenylate cyclase|nr:tetratricopeptide repeat protein [Flavobacteriales bacterium]
MLRPFTALLLLTLLNGTAAAQVQLDSLWSVWNNPAAGDSARLQAMQVLAWRTVFEQPDSGLALARKQLDLAERSANATARYEALTTLAVGSSIQSDLRASLAYLEECLLTARGMKDPKREANTYSNMSNVYKNLGDLPLALKHLQQSLRIDLQLGNKEGLAGTYNNIGNIHTELQDLPNALVHYQKSAALAEELDSDKGRAQALMNLGATHLALGERTLALDEFKRSLQVYRKLGRKLEVGMAFNNLGRCYTELGRSAEAFAALDSAQVLFEALQNKRLLARNHYYRGTLWLQEGDAGKARAACDTGVRLAREAGLAQQRKECSECLVKAYERLGDLALAFRAQKEYLQVSDSLDALNNGKEVLRMDLQRQFQERQIADSLDNARQRYERDLTYQRELGREREQRNLSLFIGGAVLLTALGLWNRLRYTRRSRALIQHERDRSDELLHNILPEEVAAELKAKGSAETQSFEQVTILFTDFQGFTQVSERLSPAELVEELNACFKAFDAIVDARGVEKIKTIGDAYMAAGGVPEPRADATLQTVLAALDMQDFIRARHAERSARGLPAFRMRAGLHTGPIVAGIVGTRKFAYDIWGDTVNTASRMESSGSVNEVNISGTTRELLNDAPGLVFDARGKVQAKGKGELEMYFVRRA